MKSYRWARRKPNIPSGPGKWGKWHLEVIATGTRFCGAKSNPETANGFVDESYLPMNQHPTKGKCCMHCDKAWEDSRRLGLIEATTDAGPRGNERSEG